VTADARHKQVTIVNKTFGCGSNITPGISGARDVDDE
jgi:hypothetical protein